jgi:precorrin-6B C5,15-methyltransferase / cobalt-precorrin-6B C5,C15-methyltransferase
MLADPSMRAVAIEPRPDRAARIARNAAAFGVPELTIVERRAPAALRDLPQPNAIFIGGGASEHGVLDGAVAALPAGGRLVVNAVTLETESILISQHARLGGELVRLAVARADELDTPTRPGGSETKPVAWRPALPVTQWAWVKP